MFFIQKTLGFMAVLAASGAASAVTARPSIVTTPGARMPTMAAYLNGNTSTNISGGTNVSGGNTTQANAECIENYTTCLKGGDVCGPNFEECTNNSLFYAKRPLCASTLMQCSTSGVQSLFGTANQTAFANKNTNGEFIYPTAGSVLGQLIEAAAISNRYDTATCVKRYTNCLQKSDVCGADFELCTSHTEFKKQKLFCESTLARCQAPGITELFGSTNTSNNPTDTSRLGILIREGADLAAVNAIATCYRVADQCILNACAANPYKCKEGASLDVSAIVDLLNAADGGQDLADKFTDALGTLTRNNVTAFVKNACLDTIGGNKFCYATTIGDGAMPTNAQLRKDDNRETIFSAVYGERMNNTMSVKIDELIEKFDKKTKQRCQDTIVQCAMANCGGGSGLACYNIAATATGGNADNASIDITKAKASIKSGCEAIINDDNSCKYAMATFNNVTGFLSYADGNLFEKLFTAPGTTTADDPLGVVATLNRKLAQSFSPTAMVNMTTQCQNAAKACIRQECGDDYVNCYRNRTDIYSSLTNTGAAGLDKSMNKVGGILDRTIITGLCMESVKSNAICNELIKANAYTSNAAVTDGGAVWGTNANTVRDSWLNVGSQEYSTIGLCSADGKIKDKSLPANAACGTTLTYTDDNGTEQTVTYNSGKIESGAYALDLAATEVFQAAVSDLEMEAQAAYNAKLTKQMNMCRSSNDGGIMGNNELGSTFMWAKLRNNKVPSGYSMSGLKAKDFTASNELYGSFCRVRVQLSSDNKDIQDAISNGKDWSTVYFAAGDAFTCGSWIPAKELERIANTVAKRATADQADRQKDTRTWLTVLGALGGGAGGAVLGSGIQQGNIMSGLTGISDKKDDLDTYKRGCKDYIKEAQNAARQNTPDYDTFSVNYELAKSYATKLGVTISDTIQAKVDDFASNVTDSAKAKVAASAVSTISTQCDLVRELPKESGVTNKNWFGTTIGATVGTIGGALLVNKATKSIQSVSLDKNKKEAYDAFMAEVGDHIQCIIGGEEVGTFGDIISTSMQ